MSWTLCRDQMEPEEYKNTETEQLAGDPKIIDEMKAETLLARLHLRYMGEDRGFMISYLGCHTGGGGRG